MEKEKNKSTGKIVVIIILVVLVIGLVGYICYDKFIIKSNNSTDKQSVSSKVKKENKDEELDINSRLVQTLYNKVSGENTTPNYSLFWKDEQKDLTTSSIEEQFPKDYYVKDASELSKMAYVGYNLSEAKKELIVCTGTDLPQNTVSKNINGSSITLHSGCDKTYNSNATTTYSYSKNEIERIYKDLYGNDAVFDTSIVIPLNQYHIENYVYDEKLGKYVIYYLEGGGMQGPGGFTTKLEKAVRTNDEVKIYEKVKLEYYDENDSESKNSLYKEETYIYTFKLDNDSMYTFVSRVKES